MQAPVPSFEKNVWILRVYFFLWLGGLGFFIPFFNIFCARLNLSGTQIGWIASISSVVLLFFSPLWTSLSRNDRTTRRLLQVALIGTALLSMLLGQQVLFIGILALSIIRSITYAGISPMSDNLAIAASESTPSGYGSIRAWASFGWALIVLLAGWMIQKWGNISIFAGTAVTMLLAAISLQFVQLHPHPETGTRATGGSSAFSVITALLHNPAAIGFGLLVIFSNLGNSGVLQFEMLYLDHLGASSLIIGIASMVGAAVELIAMPWTDRLLRGRVNSRSLLLHAMLIYIGLRLLVYLFPSIPMIIITRAFGGIAFSFYTVAGVRYASDLAPLEQRGTMLAIYTVTLINIINIIGTPLAGSLYDLAGGRVLYLGAIIGYTLGWLLFFLIKNKAGVDPALNTA